MPIFQLTWHFLLIGNSLAAERPLPAGQQRKTPSLPNAEGKPPRWNNAKIISSYWWCRNRTPWAWHVTICPQTPLQWISLPRSLLANKSPEESSRPIWRKAGGWSECLGTGQAAGYSSRLSKWQPAGRSSIVAASSFSFHFPHILQPQPQPSCSCSAKDLERSRISIASVRWGENVSLIYVLASVCVWVCVCVFLCLYQAHYFCIFFHTLRLPCTFDWGFLCVWDFCILRAFLHQKKIVRTKSTTGCVCHCHWSFSGRSCCCSCSWKKQKREAEKPVVTPWAKLFIMPFLLLPSFVCALLPPFRFPHWAKRGFHLRFLAKEQLRTLSTNVLLLLS